jgi:hypothetical protein
MFATALTGTVFVLLTGGAISSQGPQFSVTVDSARHEITIRSGPYIVPAGMGHHGDHHAVGHETPLFGFPWPVKGWLRGFRIEVEDGHGRAVHSELLHHMNLLHLDRRQLIDAAAERVLASGQETAPVLLPSSVGIPLAYGARLGLVAAWFNDTASEVPDVWLRVVFRFSPSTLVPAPLDVLPVGFDVGYAVGTSDAYDLPPGRSIKAREFVMPLDARLLAAGGHLHQYGVSVRLEEAESGRIVVELKPETEPGGEIRRMPVKLLGVSGAGLRLHAGRRYRIVGEYDNRSGITIPEGAMAVMAALLRPDCILCWPRINRDDGHYTMDLATLPGDGWAGINWLEAVSSD